MSAGPGTVRVLAAERLRLDQRDLGIKLDPFALIKGSATFGYRDFAAALSQTCRRIRARSRAPT